MCKLFNYVEKKLMILGGSSFVIPLIEKAHELGIYVITCDYLPNNIAHKYSDEYVNASVMDKEVVLKEARRLHIDGISSFACDPGVITAAYVADKMGLPNVGSYESVCILQNKTLFRSFLKEHNFNVPFFKSYSTIETVINDNDVFPYPVIVKPVDSAGSKGVTKVNGKHELSNAVEYAFSNSFSHTIIIEKFLEKKGFASNGDCFSYNGKLVFCPFTDQLFDSDSVNIYNPCGTKLPSSMPSNIQLELKNELQRLITLLDMKTSIYNFECRLSDDGKPYIMELSPRGGGNKIAELESLIYDFDYFDYIVKSYIGVPFSFEEQSIKKPGFMYVLHSNKKGVFKGINIDNGLSKHLVYKDIHIKQGDFVEPFTGSNKSFGFLTFLFPDNNICEFYKNHVKDYVKVLIDE